VSDFLVDHTGSAIVTLVAALIAYRTYWAVRAAKQAQAGACARCGRLASLMVPSDDGPECEECGRLTERGNRIGMYFLGSMTAVNAVILVCLVVDSVHRGISPPWDVLGVLGPAVLFAAKWTVSMWRRAART
jgi:hypothetical protein